MIDYRNFLYSNLVSNFSFQTLFGSHDNKNITSKMSRKTSEWQQHSSALARELVGGDVGCIKSGSSLGLKDY